MYTQIKLEIWNTGGGNDYYCQQQM